MKRGHSKHHIRPLTEILSRISIGGFSLGCFPVIYWIFRVIFHPSLWGPSPTFIDGIVVAVLGLLSFTLFYERFLMWFGVEEPKPRRK